MIWQLWNLVIFFMRHIIIFKGLLFEYDRFQVSLDIDQGTKGTLAVHGLPNRCFVWPVPDSRPGCLHMHSLGTEKLTLGWGLTSRPGGQGQLGQWPRNLELHLPQGPYTNYWLTWAFLNIDILLNLNFLQALERKELRLEWQLQAWGAVSSSDPMFFSDCVIMESWLQSKKRDYVVFMTSSCTGI